MDAEGVRARLYDRQDCEIDPGIPEQVRRSLDGVIGTLPAVIDAKGVMHVARTVHADADVDSVSGEGLDPFLVEQRGVRLDRHLHGRHVGERLSSAKAHRVESPRSDQGRLAAMEHERHAALTREEAVTADALDRRIERLVRHDGRARLPGRVTLVVDVAVGAVEVATSRDLQNERTECVVDAILRRAVHRRTYRQRDPRRRSRRRSMPIPDRLRALGRATTRDSNDHRSANG